MIHLVAFLYCMLPRITRCLKRWQLLVNLDVVMAKKRKNVPKMNFSDKVVFDLIKPLHFENR